MGDVATSNPGVKAVDELPKMIKDAVVKQIMMGVPLRKIGAMCGLSYQTIKRYRDQRVAPKLDVLPEYGHVKDVTTQDPENREVISKALDQAVTACNKSNKSDETLGMVQRAVIRMRKRAEGVLTRVESRPDDQFSGREWASVATVAARMMETQARMNGELNDHKGPGDVNIQINMPASSRRSDAAPIDVDVVRTIKSE